MIERDEVRDQIRAAAHAAFCGCLYEHADPNHSITTGGLDRVTDAVMAIVDPIAAERDAQLRVRAAVEEVLDEELGTEPTAETQGGYVANVRLMVSRLRAERDEARAKLQHAQTYADNCAKHAAVEVLRGDVAWHLRQIVTQPPHNCADASCSIQIDACGACCTCLGGCVYNGPGEPTGEVLIELRDWLITGEQIADDPEEHGLRTFVPTDEIHEIIAAYLKANGITPPAGKP